MSAKLSDQDKHWVGVVPTKGRKLNQVEEALIATTFDTETDYDVTNITNLMEKVKLINRLCVVKLLQFIPEQILTYIFLGSARARTHRKSAAVYLKFLRKKISLDNFQKDLLSITKDSIII